MGRTTIDFGIDLGTTNSAVAALNGTETTILKNNFDRDITASAVHINRQGRVRVGQRARNRMEDARAVGAVYTEFKRRMGTDHVYEFSSAGVQKTPEELSAEVLKSLREDVNQRLGEAPRAAVITVPAAFEQVQCAATKRAGELAGLEQCPLLQEPVAAALAYGFQTEARRQYWLVYDFGGGTFDAALMKADDGIIEVVNHGGDNYLGGSDIDWAIVEKVILPRVRGEYNLTDFTRGNPRWRTAFAVIKRAAEVAKIELSRSQTAYLEDCRFADADGEEVDLMMQITRDEVVSVARPIIDRSIKICRRVFKEAGIASADVGKVILVGGPTLAPYFREILHSELGIELNHSIDPLTVVARGAAVFAGTQILREGEQGPKGAIRLDLRYSPVGADEDPPVRGRVCVEEGASLDGYTIQFTNQQTKWSSGRVPVGDSGAFRVDLLAERGIQNVFGIDLFDARGTRQPTSPDSLTYTIGATVSEQTVINSLGVALANNEFSVFFQKGTPLPARKTMVYRTTEPLKKGDTGEVLQIPVVEGENEKADRNRLQDSLTVSGSHVRRDLPMGSEVEVTLIMDESRIIRAKAYVPMLDEEFETVIDPAVRTPDAGRLKKELSEERKRLSELRQQGAEPDSQGEHEEQVQEVEELIEAAEADPGAASKAEARLLELKVQLDKCESAARWPSLVEEVRKELDDLDELIEKVGDEGHRRRAAALRAEVEELIADKRDDRLPRKKEQVLDLYREVLMEQDGFWVAIFQDLQGKRDQMTDQAAAGHLFEQGTGCLQRGDAQNLRNVVVRLLGLLPREVAEAVQRGYGSGIIQ